MLGSMSAGANGKPGRLRGTLAALAAAALGLGTLGLAATPAAAAGPLAVAVVAPLTTGVPSRASWMPPGSPRSPHPRGS